MIQHEWWCVGHVQCLSCTKEWVGVWELAQEELQCPYCGSKDTVREQLTDEEVAATGR